jgi:Ca2+/Na+ antiporter
MQMTSLELSKHPENVSDGPAAHLPPDKSAIAANSALENGGAPQAAHEERVTSGSAASIPRESLQGPAPWQASLGHSLSAYVDGLAFLTSMCWIQLVAEEIVAMLDFIGTIINVDHTLLGLTLLAWGELISSCDCIVA